MRTVQISGACDAPSSNPEALQAARIASRINCSAAVAGVMAGLAWGVDQRDHDVLLLAVMTSRVEGSTNG